MKQSEIKVGHTYLTKAGVSRQVEHIRRWSSTARVIWKKTDGPKGSLKSGTCYLSSFAQSVTRDVTAETERMLGVQG